jgi:hypothetical protein
MGCFESRSDLTYEEAAVATGENLLLYTSYNFTDLHAFYIKSAENGYISKQNFKLFIDHFGLQFKEERFVAFYEKRMTDNKYPLKFLVTLTALLSKGSVSSKASAIFETFMVVKAKALSKKGLFEFLDLAFELVSVELPRFVPPPDSNNNYTADELGKSLKYMHAGTESIKNEIFEALFVNKCTSVMGAAFVKWAEDDQNKGYFESIELRKKLKHRGKHLLHEEKKKLKEEAPAERGAHKEPEATHSNHHSSKET